MSARFAVGDRVALVSLPLGPARGLRVGQQGVVLMDAETAGEEGGQVVVRFSRRGVGAARPVRIATRYLRLVSRKAPRARRQPPEVTDGG